MKIGTAVSGDEAGPVGIGPHLQGAARDLSVTLSNDQQNLVLILTPNYNDNYSTNVSYSIFWLDPTVFSQADIYGQYGTGGGAVTPGFGLNLIQARKKVVDVQGGGGIVSATVPYLPYVSGGWMYATVLPVGGTKEYRLAGTNFVAVPVLGPAGEPLVAEAPINLNVTTTTLSGSNRLVHFTWRNAAALTTVAYIKITLVNYFNDGFQRDVAIFRVNTSPGVQQGFTPLNFSLVDNAQTVILEADNTVSPGHSLTWYFVPMSPALTPLHLTASPSYGTLNIT